MCKLYIYFSWCVCLQERVRAYLCVSKCSITMVVNQMGETDSKGVLVHGLEEGGESATHVIACSSWQCLLCGWAVACWFRHNRHGNMHVHINFPCLAPVKTKPFKAPMLLPGVMIACWETRSGWCEVKCTANWATLMSIAWLHRRMKMDNLWVFTDMFEFSI